jgi:hypothetical protein
MDEKLYFVRERQFDSETGDKMTNFVAICAIRGVAWQMSSFSFVC